ncbi:MAG: putative toxin-antitoxin system toxin component, PIN family [Flavobacteriales bacterium CG18_big_fil_WC_8_21_14_2_50_32_9]|nr:MAG: putative toxin-antitoxin system toxin component, PIN family [Flavobacteriales bacterium CG18_big_fil_WC_8_21_14_2_50_32_9]
MKKKVKRIIIDTNLWISFLITKDFTKLDEIIFSRQAILVFSQELLDEFLEVAKRPKFRRFFSASDIEEILETIDEYADFVKVKTKIEVCRDPKDNFLLSLSVDGNVNFLLTGDIDLLDLNKFGETTIITISDFLKEK